jgi:hypothetical protein
MFVRALNVIQDELRDVPIANTKVSECGAMHRVQL